MASKASLKTMSKLIYLVLALALITAFVSLAPKENTLSSFTSNLNIINSKITGAQFATLDANFSVAATKPIAGYVLHSDNTTLAVNASVTVYVNTSFGFINPCYTLPAVYTGIGAYATNLGNLRRADNGGDCSGFWFTGDPIWAEVDGSTIVPVPQGNGISPLSTIAAGTGLQYLQNTTLAPAADTTDPQVYLVSPANTTNETANNVIVFKYNASDDTGLENCSIYLNGNLNQTNTSPVNNAINNFTITLPNGIYNWSVTCYDTGGNSNSSETWILNVSLPFVNNAPQFISATDDFSTSLNPTNIGANVTFSVNASDSDLDSYQLVICNSSSISQLGVCADTLLCNSSFTASETTATCQHNTTGETQQTYNWYSFVCDGTNCSTQNNTNSPYYLNFHPYSSTVPNQTWAEDNNQTLNLSTYFSDPDNDQLNYTSTSPQNITVNINNQNKIVTFIPDANWNGIRTIIFTAHDPYSLTNTSNTITLNVTSVNDLPSITNQTYTNYTGHVFSSTITASDADNLLNCTLFHSTTSSYTPKPMVLVAGTQSSGTWVANLSTADGYSVFDVINTYAVCNDTLTTVNTSIKNNIIPNYQPTNPVIEISPDPPTAADDLYCNITTNSIDTDTDSVSYYYFWYKDNVLNLSTGPVGQTTSIIGAGNTSQNELWNCSVIATDFYENSSTIMDSVTVASSPPTFNSSNPINNISWPEDTSNDTLNLSIYFQDQDGDNLTFHHTPVQNITVQINHISGMVNFTPNSNWYGTRTIRFNATDGSTWSDYSNYVTLNVTNVNDAPVIDNVANQSLAEDTSPPDNWIDLHNYSYDIDNSYAQLTYNLVSQSNSTLINCIVLSNRYINCSTPAYDQNGVTYLNISVTDGEFTDYDFTNITVFPVNDAPNASDPEYPPPGEETANNTPTFNGSESSDPDGDNITYFLLVDCNSTSLNFTILDDLTLYEGSNISHWALNASNALPEGYCNWTLMACDDSGADNNCTVSNARNNITIDLTPPIIVIDEPDPDEVLGWVIPLLSNVNDRWTRVSEAWFEIINSTGYIVENGSLYENESWDYYWDSSEVFGVTGVVEEIFSVSDGENMQFSIASNGNESNFTYVVHANDTLGHEDNSSINFSVSEDVPSVNIIYPKGDNLSSDFNINIQVQSGNLSQSWWNITNSSNYLFANNSNLSLNGNFINWTDYINVSGWPSGIYNISAFAGDFSGKNRTEGNYFNLDVDAPSFSNPTRNPDPSYNTDTVYLNITWQDNNVVETVYIYHNATGSWQQYLASNTGNLYYVSISPTELTNQENIGWNSSAQDNFGNWNTTMPTQTFQIMNRPPTLNATNPIYNISWAEDTIFASLNLSQHFYDLDSDSFNFTNTSVNNISITINQNSGIVSFVPENNFTGIRYVTFYAQDFMNITASNNVTLNVTPVNDAPFITAISMNVSSGPMGTPVNVTSVGAGDIDGDNYKLQCGNQSGNYNLCNSSFGTGQRSCIFNSPWNDPATKTIYCVINDSLALSSEVTDNFFGTNQAPNITNINAPTSVNEGDWINVSFGAVDPDADPINYSIYRNGSQIATTNISNWLTNLNSAGDYNYTFYVNDSYGASDTESRIITVNNTNQAPSLSVIIPNQSWVRNTNQTLNLSQYFTDPDSDNLTYTSTSPQNITVHINEDIVTLEPDYIWFGTRYIIFTANDSQYTTDSNNVTLNVTAASVLPKVTEFDNHTNFTYLFNTNGHLQSVQNMFLENTTWGKIQWHNPVNSEYEDYDAYIEIRRDYVEVLPSGLHSSINSSATIWLYNLSFEEEPQIILYENGYWSVCPNTTCNIISYQNNTLMFNVTHFSGFAASTAPLLPYLRIPEHQSTIWIRNPTFDWSDSTDPNPEDTVTHYTLQYTTDSSFTTGITNVTVNANASSYSIPWANRLNDNTLYYWRVQAWNDKSIGSGWTSPFWFIINTTANNCTTDLLPHEVEGAVYHYVTNPVPAGTLVRLEIQDGPNQGYRAYTTVDNDFVPSLEKGNGYYLMMDNPCYRTGDNFTMYAENGTHEGWNYNNTFVDGTTGAWGTGNVDIYLNNTIQFPWKPVNLSAYPVGDGSTIYINWSPSYDAEYYAIYSSHNLTFNRTSGLLDTTTDTFYYDSASDAYLRRFYLVEAVNHGLYNTSDEYVGKYKIPVKDGLNLVSLPLLVDENYNLRYWNGSHFFNVTFPLVNNSAHSDFNITKFYRRSSSGFDPSLLWVFNPTYGEYWASAEPSFVDLDNDRGYYAEVEAPDTSQWYNWTVAGRVASGTRSITLDAGLNLVGFTMVVNGSLAINNGTQIIISPANLFINNSEYPNHNITGIWRYNTTAFGFLDYIDALDSFYSSNDANFTVIEPGKAYFMEIISANNQSRQFNFSTQ